MLEQGVPLEDVQRLAGHADPRTTGLYDRRMRKITRNIVEQDFGLGNFRGPPGAGLLQRLALNSQRGTLIELPLVEGGVLQYVRSVAGPSSALPLFSDRPPQSDGYSRKFVHVF